MVPTDIEIGARIAAGRRSRGLSQSGFAKLMDVNPQTVSRWEVGAFSLTATRLLAICEVLQLDPGDLLAPVEDVS